MNANVTAFPVPPVVKRVTIGLPVDAAFERFTAGIADWWPLDGFSVSGDRAETVLMEQRAGGRLVERTREGEEHLWGTITAWQPPHALSFTWHAGRDADVAQEVEIKFARAGPKSTLVTLVHRGWEALGQEAQAVRERYEGGWEKVLGVCYADIEGDKA